MHSGTINEASDCSEHQHSGCLFGHSCALAARPVDSLWVATERTRSAPQQMATVAGQQYSVMPARRSQPLVKLCALNNLPGRQGAAKMHADDEILIAPATFAP